MTDPSVLIGVLRRISDEVMEGVSVDIALRVIAAELEKGGDLFFKGRTRSLTPEQARNGQLIGDPK